MNDEIKVEEIIGEEPVVSEEEELVEEIESLPETVMLGSKEYTLLKTGVDQAQQVSDLLNWLGSYGNELASVLVSDDEDATENIVGSTWNLLSAIGKVSSKDALIDLFIVVIGCSKQEAIKYFGINILIDGVQVLLSQEEYGKVLDRFF